MRRTIGARGRFLAGTAIAASIFSSGCLRGSDDQATLSHISNVARGKPVTVDSIYNSVYLPANAVDGDRKSVSSRWLSARTNNLDWSGNPHWIEIDLRGTYRITELRFWAGAENEYKWPPADFKFQRWNNGAWVDIFAEADNSNPVYSRKFPPVLADRVRLQATRGTDVGALRLYEIEVYGH
jgi:hypothetical protein